MRLEQRSPGLLFLPQQLPPPLLLLTASHAHHLRTKSAHFWKLPFAALCSSSSGKGYLETALACLTEWANSKTQTQTNSGNPEESQACSLTHASPYSGLGNVPALTKTMHGIIFSAPPLEDSFKLGPETFPYLWTQIQGRFTSPQLRAQTTPPSPLCLLLLLLTTILVF